MNRLIEIGFDARGKRKPNNQLVVSYYGISTPDGLEYAGVDRAHQLLEDVPAHPIPDWKTAATYGIHPLIQVQG